MREVSHPCSSGAALHRQYHKAIKIVSSALYANENGSFNVMMSDLLFCKILVALKKCFNKKKHHHCDLKKRDSAAYVMEVLNSRDNSGNIFFENPG